MAILGLAEGLLVSKLCPIWFHCCGTIEHFSKFFQGDRLFRLVTAFANVTG
jgi:hypothetical protein